jgi:surface carbohydrate biosynthesis protein
MKRLYLPLEIVVREFDSKILLGCEAVRQGWFVVAGSKKSVSRAIDKYGPGVVLVKSLTESESIQFSGYRRRGCRVVSLDEEGVVTYPEFLTSSIRYSDQTAAQAERVFFWGQEQRQYFNEALPHHGSKGLVTGSPRVDFWKNFAKQVYAEKITELKAKYGNYVFFASSFGIANHYQGGNVGLTSTLSLFKNLSPELKRFIQNQWIFNRAVFEEYFEVIDELATALHGQGLNLVIRPHPSESKDRWLALSQRHDNVYVEYKGGVTAWILGAQTLIHFKSTTALEAYFMDVPCVTYVPPMPAAFEKFELKVPNVVSNLCHSRKEFIQSCLLMEPTTDKKNAKLLLQKWVHDNGSSASETIVRELGELEEDTQLQQYGMSLGRGRASIITRIRSMLSVNKSYGAHKTAGLDPSLASRIVLEFNKMKHTDVCLDNVGDLFVLRAGGP